MLYPQTPPTINRLASAFTYKWRAAATNGDRVLLAGAAVLAGLVALSAVLYLFGIGLSGLEWLVNRGAATPRWVASLELVQVVIDPIRGYLATHADALPVNAEILYGAWTVAVVVLLIAAAAGSWAGRIGWTILGAGTCWMVWAGTGTGSQGLAVGIAATAWALLGLAAFRRLPRRPRTTNVDVGTVTVNNRQVADAS